MIIHIVHVHISVFQFIFRSQNQIAEEYWRIWPAWVNTPSNNLRWIVNHSAGENWNAFSPNSFAILADTISASFVSFSTSVRSDFLDFSVYKMLKSIHSENKIAFLNDTCFTFRYVNLITAQQVSILCPNTYSRRAIMPRNQFQRTIFALLTVVVTVHAYVFFSLYVLHGDLFMQLTGETSVLAQFNCKLVKTYVLQFPICILYTVILHPAVYPYCFQIPFQKRYCKQKRRMGINYI